MIRLRSLIAFVNTTRQALAVELDRLAAVVGEAARR